MIKARGIAGAVALAIVSTPGFAWENGYGNIPIATQAPLKLYKNDSYMTLRLHENANLRQKDKVVGESDVVTLGYGVEERTNYFLTLYEFNVSRGLDGEDASLSYQVEIKAGGGIRFKKINLGAKAGIDHAKIKSNRLGETSETGLGGSVFLGYNFTENLYIGAVQSITTGVSGSSIEIRYNFD